MFGLLHLTNSFTATNIPAAAFQSLNAIGSGLVLCAIYARSHSIYYVMFIHGFWDAALATESGFFGIGSVLKP